MVYFSISFFKIYYNERQGFGAEAPKPRRRWSAAGAAAAAASCAVGVSRQVDKLFKRAGIND